MANVWLLMNLVFFIFGTTLSFAGSARAPKSGGTLRFGLQKDIVSLNPFQRTQSVTKNVGSIAFECLLTADKNDELKPSLATSWTVSEDGLQYQFTLRKGVKFHDGKEMTPEDVLWSIQYARDPKNAAQGRDMLLAVVSATAPGPSTVRITLKEPYVPFLAALASFEAFPVVPKESVPPGREKLSLYPPGTGPFMMAEYKPNQLIAFKKFDQYWQKGIPYLEEVHFRPVEDDTVRLTAIRSGDLDVMERVLYEHVLRIQKGEIKGLGVVMAEASGYVAPAFNTESPPFNNVKLRRAVLYALDKEKILEGVTWGFGVVADQKMPRQSRWFVTLPQQKRDIEKATALIKEAGYPNGLKVKAQVANAKRDQDVMQIIQSQLKEANIHLELDVRDFTRHLNDLRDGNFTFSMSASAISVDPDLAYYDSFHTDREAKKISNYPRYSNPKMDALLEQGRRESDSRKRYQIYKEIVELLQEEVPDVPLGFTPHVFAFRSNVKDFQAQPTGPFYYGLGGLGMTWLER